ncbi:RNA polymerase sigma-70 factor (ECF subfamily) [Sinimarinibacterium flocculans]|uniref:RNA polymerase sigma-70 factor (ECF subfamily) n=2 Tax=Sinimarinibacterium flocculans TaxID=985250 RepID=A0A318ECF7_9GAMM|nr:RNA polymerase sigma-70 factor (ECF subfamily) [Sinimarinibacterium flocculans]
MAWTADRIPGVQSGANDDDQNAGDAELVRRAAAGDARAFERLYRANVGRVYGLCVRLTDGDRARAEQYTQDAFVRAWEKLDGFRGEAQFSTWLHRLTVNLVLGERRLLRRWVSFDDHVAAGEDGEAAEAAAFGEHPQQRVGDRMDLERALAKLPRGARAVLMLHDVEGYRHDEIAALTGIAVGTSKAQLHRARKLMKEWLR